MNILALEPYYGGSHKAFLDGWRQHSEHEFTLLTLPASKWKWRMRHAAITFAQQVDALISNRSSDVNCHSRLNCQSRLDCHSRESGNPMSQPSWDVLFCSDMLNLAEFCGLVNEPIRQLPKIVYFHENQLTYPVQVESERDYQYCMTNITTALAADAVWFNSAFHRDGFLDAAGRFLKHMPDYQPLEVVESIGRKSAVHPPGIMPIERQPESCETVPLTSGETPCRPPRILWAARWEHDKNPEDFFAAVKLLKDKGIDFRLNVIGEQFRDCPEVFAWAGTYFADHIDRWGYQPTRTDYERALAESDIVVSTANHEFFGIGILEAIAAGCRPLLPDRLSYPALMSSLAPDNPQAYLYDGSVNGLAGKLSALVKNSTPPPIPPAHLYPYYWPERAGRMDRAVANFSA